jgi:uncharacterized damage-inducible protein DinB
MLYRISTTPTTTSAIAGQNLSRVHRSKDERAFIAADLHLNRVALVSPTVRQCAGLADVSRAYVNAALPLADNPAAREAVISGQVPLLGAAKALNSESLAEHFARASADEWLEVARVIGPAVIWDQMIAPNI